jgi:hypothetical protein
MDMYRFTPNDPVVLLVAFIIWGGTISSYVLVFKSYLCGVVQVLFKDYRRYLMCEISGNISLD